MGKGKKKGKSKKSKAKQTVSEDPQDIQRKDSPSQTLETPPSPVSAHSYASAIVIPNANAQGQSKGKQKAQEHRSGRIPSNPPPSYFLQAARLARLKWHEYISAITGNYTTCLKEIVIRSLVEEVLTDPEDPGLDEIIERFKALLDLVSTAEQRKISTNGIYSTNTRATHTIDALNPKGASSVGLSTTRPNKSTAGSDPSFSSPITGLKTRLLEFQKHVAEKLLHDAEQLRLKQVKKLELVSNLSKEVSNLYQIVCTLLEETETVEHSLDKVDDFPTKGNFLDTINSIQDLAIANSHQLESEDNTDTSSYISTSRTMGTNPGSSGTQEDYAVSPKHTTSSNSFRHDILSTPKQSHTPARSHKLADNISENKINQLTIAGQKRVDSVASLKNTSPSRSSDIDKEELPGPNRRTKYSETYSSPSGSLSLAGNTLTEKLVVRGSTKISSTNNSHSDTPKQHPGPSITKGNPTLPSLPPMTHFDTENVSSKISISSHSLALVPPPPAKPSPDILASSPSSLWCSLPTAQVEISTTERRSSDVSVPPSSMPPSRPPEVQFEYSAVAVQGFREATLREARSLSTTRSDTPKVDPELSALSPSLPSVQSSKPHLGGSPIAEEAFQGQAYIGFSLPSSFELGKSTPIEKAISGCKTETSSRRTSSHTIELVDGPGEINIDSTEPYLSSTIQVEGSTMANSEHDVPISLPSFPPVSIATGHPEVSTTPELVSQEPPSTGPSSSSLPPASITMSYPEGSTTPELVSQEPPSARPSSPSLPEPGVFANEQKELILDTISSSSPSHDTEKAPEPKEIWVHFTGPELPKLIPYEGLTTGEQLKETWVHFTGPELPNLVRFEGLTEAEKILDVTIWERPSPPLRLPSPPINGPTILEQTSQETTIAEPDSMSADQFEVSSTTKPSFDISSLSPPPVWHVLPESQFVVSTAQEKAESELQYTTANCDSNGDMEQFEGQPNQKMLKGKLVEHHSPSITRFGFPSKSFDIIISGPSFPSLRLPSIPFGISTIAEQASKGTVELFSSPPFSQVKDLHVHLEVIPSDPDCCLRMEKDSPFWIIVASLLLGQSA
ncbi:hypothetical protein M501DRAFT_991720 [Patellaria atrata CBS 101060]|uniref:Uncharacterized protein n=1 Tax=Patellaria atrata CBS 101060 TaxID=1346257 RepID=A0A9P4SBQ7_9PEZI|nr:hypothetical protein M501DRAFT_991720 [Patellaria atrata CBS 101060]